jgi:hypothetical protein
MERRVSMWRRKTGITLRNIAAVRLENKRRWEHIRRNLSTRRAARNWRRDGTLR